MFDLMRMALLEKLVAGVEKMGTELIKINKKLSTINTVLCKGTIQEADEIINEGLDNEWCNMWQGKKMEGVWELQEENKAFIEFYHGYEDSKEKEQEEEQGQEQKQEAE